MKVYAPLLLTTALLGPLHTYAGPSDSIHSPAVEYGEKEIDFKVGSASSADAPRASEASIGFGYGVKEWWFTELYLKYKREGDQGVKHDAVEWENKFQLTQTGEYPVDVGFLVEIERPRDHAEGWEIKWGPLFETDFGKVQLNVNPLFKRHYRAEEPSDTEFLYEWQAKYRWKQEFEFGLQGFGEMGKWNHWAPADERSHRVGPAIFGKLHVSSTQAIKYNAAWLFGASKAAADNTFRLQIEYEF